jgi:tetratricopeptide (TPR) repeat protein
MGDLPSARRHIERVLADYVNPEHRLHIIRFQFDQRVTAGAIFAHILWLQGFPDQAIRTAENAVEAARGAGHRMSLCYALTWAACPIALWAGDLSAAERYVKLVLDHTATHALMLWHAWGVCHHGVLTIKRGDIVAGLRLLRTGLDELGGARSGLGYVAFQCELAEAIAHGGQVLEALATVEGAIARSERTGERWALAELLRIEGEVLLLSDKEDTTTAEDHFRRSLELSHQQGALFWELRTAMSLARLRRDQGRIGEARDVLASVYDRFTEGFGTADLKAAKALLSDLANLPR